MRTCKHKMLLSMVAGTKKVPNGRQLVLQLRQPCQHLAPQELKIAVLGNTALLEDRTILPSQAKEDAEDTACHVLLREGCSPLWPEVSLCARAPHGWDAPPFSCPHTHWVLGQAKELAGREEKLSARSLAISSPPPGTELLIFCLLSTAAEQMGLPPRSPCPPAHGQEPGHPAQLYQ